MTLDELVLDIQNDFIDSPPKNLIKMKVNNVIRMINSVVGKRRQILFISNTGGYWEDLDETWEDLDEEWEGLQRWNNNFTWDSTKNCLVAPTDLIGKVEVIWVDDTRWEGRDYEAVVNSEYANIYCHVGNEIFFSEDMDTSTKVIKMQVRLKFGEVASDGTINLPEGFRLILLSGATYLLAITQKYRDERLRILHEEIYDNYLNLMRAKANSADSPDVLNLGAVDDLEPTVPIVTNYEEI